MLLRSSISNTKRFFQKTFHNFKSLFSAEHAADYQKLPKASPFTLPDPNARPKTSSRDSDKKKIMSTANMGGRKNNEFYSVAIGRANGKEVDLYTKSEREARCLAVAKKLKEMEMMDMSNVDHVLDIEEILHYYSRLTCPVYLDIVDKFFMELYREFLGPPASTASPKSVNSKPKYRSVMIRA